MSLMKFNSNTALQIKLVKVVMPPSKQEFSMANKLQSNKSKRTILAYHGTQDSSGMKLKNY